MPVVLRSARSYAESISIRCVTALYGFRPYGGSLFPDAEKVTMGLSRDNGRLAQARWFPHSGTVMGARRDGPSMAHRGWRGVLPRHPHNSTCVRPSVMGPSGVWNISVAAVGLSYKLQTRRKPLPDKGLAIKSEFTLRFLRILWYKMRRFAGIARRAQTHTRVDTMTWVPSALKLLVGRWDTWRPNPTY